MTESEVVEAGDVMDAITMGYISWTIYGALSFFNFLYYSDAFYRAYTMNNFTEGAQWRTLNGSTEWTRKLLNIGAWGVMGLGWVFTIFAGELDISFVIFQYLTLGMGILTIAKFFLWILSFFVAIIYDFSLYPTNEFVFPHYVGLNGWGMWLGIGEFEDWFDLELEAFNIGGQAIAYPMYLIGLSAYIAIQEATVEEEVVDNDLDTEEEELYAW